MLCAGTLVTAALLYSGFCATLSLGMPLHNDKLQQVFQSPQDTEEVWSNAFKHSGLSKWSLQTKNAFIEDLKADKAGDWTVVMGNEAGDLDSLVSALAYSWHLAHLDEPKKAVALLQTEEDAIDLRPENTYALKKSGMKHAHKDLLALDDLPFHRAKVAQKVEALALVDHNTLLSTWKADDKVVSVIDHHADRGTFPDAHPRVIEVSGSCSTLVAREMLNHEHEADEFPPELVDLLISTIALDTDDPEPDTIDYKIAKELFPYSSWADKDFEKAIHKLDKKLTKEKKALGHLNVRDLLRRDWKGDVVRAHPHSNSTSGDEGRGIHLGFASIPSVGLRGMVERTESKTPDEYFEIESAFTHEIQADISVALTKFKDENKDKHREIILVVKATHRLSEETARSVYEAIVREVEASPELNVTEWKGDLGESGHKRKVWWNNNLDAGRKVVRPIIENAVQHWEREHNW